MSSTTKTVISFDSETVILNSEVIKAVLGDYLWDTKEISRYVGNGWQLVHDANNNSHWELTVDDPNVATLLLLQMKK